MHLAALISISAVAAVIVTGQSKGPAAAADYGKWETLVGQTRGGLSPDGRWVAYGINRSNRENELRFTKVADGTTTTAAFGSQPAFSADSWWAAYAIGQSETQEEKLRQQKKPVQRKLGILSLDDRQITTIDAIESFAFDASGRYLAMKRYPPERKDQPPSGQGQSSQGPAAPGSADEEPSGATLIVRELATGRDTTFGNITEYVWQEKDGCLRSPSAPRTRPATVSSCSIRPPALSGSWTRRPRSIRDSPGARSLTTSPFFAERPTTAATVRLTLRWSGAG
jgi:hypothetical protein